MRSHVITTHEYGNEHSESNNTGDRTRSHKTIAKKIFDV